jgi:ribosomal protein S21
MILVEACKQFLNNGINVVPFKTTPDPIKSHKFNKKPVIKEVSNFFNHFLLKSKVEEVFKPANSVALVCGAISKNLIVIDVENANYTASKMYDEFKTSVIKNGTMKILKDHRYYIKPSQRRRMAIAEAKMKNKQNQKRRSNGR